MFFEYAGEKRSKLASAQSSQAAGPWKIMDEYLKADENSWYSYHLSPGPVVSDTDKRTVMFYNGSNAEAQWRIGWLIMDDNGKITDRSGEPLISPSDIEKGESDIAFAASAVMQKNEIWLYCTTADNTTYRAILTALR